MQAMEHFHISVMYKKGLCHRNCIEVEQNAPLFLSKIRTQSIVSQDNVKNSSFTHSIKWQIGNQMYRI